MSFALGDFQTSLRQPQELIRREARFNDPPTPKSATAVLALRGGATVLLVATFERFIRDTLVEHLQRLTVVPPPVPFDDLPEKLRISSVFISLEMATRGRLSGLQPGKIHRLPRVKQAASFIVSGLIDPAALSETGGNPGADNVRELFANVGLGDIFGRVRPGFDQLWPKPEATDFLPTKLDEIVNSRHRVAHRADALSISRVQLAEWPPFLSALAQVLDDELEAHVNGLIAAHSSP
jgi:hypothetical protein